LVKTGGLIKASSAVGAVEAGDAAASSSKNFSDKTVLIKQTWLDLGEI